MWFRTSVFSQKMICLHHLKCVTFVLYHFSGTLSAWVCLAVIAQANHEIDGNWQFFTPCIETLQLYVSCVLKILTDPCNSAGNRLHPSSVVYLCTSCKNAEMMCFQVKFVFGTSWLHLCLVCYAYSMVHCKSIWVTSTIFWSSQLHACCVCDHTLQTSREATNLILNPNA